MKSILSLLFALTIANLVHAELTIISTEHRDEDSFKRFTEYLGGKPNDGRYSVLRSVPDSRNGFYISLKASDKEIISSTKSVTLSFVRPGTQEIEKKVFENVELRKKRILLGMTESDWSAENSRPVAWKIEFFDASRSLLDSARSFLWSE